MSASARVAVMTCVRNEEDFLEAHLRFHHRLGVERAYVFLDRCSDRSEEVARSFSWVDALAEDRTPDIRYLLHHQNRCAAAALERARSDGIEWLLHLDADELAWGDNGRDELAADGSLQLLVSRSQPDTEMIVLRTKEVLPVLLPERARFWEQVYFQQDRVWERDLLDPTSGEIRRLPKWFGHDIGKSIVRVSAPVVPQTSHRWMRAHSASSETAELRTERLGFHYHYVFTSASHWQRKYRALAAEPAEWSVGGVVPFPKQTFKEASIRLTSVEARDYYQRWLAISGTTAEDLLIQGFAVRDPRARRLFQSLSAPQTDPSPKKLLPR